jgi:hypothetical protein
LNEIVDINDVDRETLSQAELAADTMARENIQRILEDRKAGNITLSEELAVKVIFLMLTTEFTLYRILLTKSLQQVFPRKKQKTNE